MNAGTNPTGWQRRRTWSRAGADSSAHPLVAVGRVSGVPLGEFRNARVYASQSATWARRLTEPVG